MKYILNMCLIHLQSIKMKNRICFKYCLGICLMHYVWNMLNIILEVIETFHTHSPCTLCVYCMHFGTNCCPKHTGTSRLRTEGLCQPSIPLPAEVPWPPWLSQGSTITLFLHPAGTGPGGLPSVGLSASLSFIFAK